MSCFVFAAIINLQLTSVWCQQYPDNPDSLQLINRLTEFFRFDHHIFLTDSSTDLNRWLPMSQSSSGSSLDNLTPQTVYTFDNLLHSDFDVTQRVALKAIGSKNKFLVVVVNNLKLENDSKLLAQVEAIRDLDINVKVGVFFARYINSLDSVEQLFRWSWEAGVVNIFSAFYLNEVDDQRSFNVFKYNPFGTSDPINVTFELINETKSESLNDYFPDRVPNYSKHPLEFVVVRDIEMSVSEIEFWNTVVSLFNASQSKLYIDLADYNAFVWESGDIMPHDNELTLEEQSLQTYPHRQVTMEMIVPHARPYSDFLAYLQNGTWKLLIIYGSVLMLTSSFLLIVSGYFRTKKILLFQSVLDVVNLLINDNSAIKYRNVHLADGCITVPLTFAGLIVMNGILSVFQSYITLPIFQPQVKSITELYVASIPILVNELEWKEKIVVLLEDVSQHGGWGDKVHGTNLNQLMDEIYTFNNSHAFFVFDYDAKIFLEAQKRLALTAYYLLSETFLGGYLGSYQLRPNFPFINPINDIIHRLNGAGLIDKWTAERYEHKVKGLWDRNFKLQFKNGDDESDVSKFAVPTVVWCGWIASGVVFICEIFWDKIKSYHCNRRNKRQKLRK